MQEELRWRIRPVTGLKADLVSRLTSEDLARSWASDDGFIAASWVERICGTRAPLPTFCHKETLVKWVLTTLPGRRQ